ncbi:MAG TPA: TadE/TadG family type IV pilus assembly protein [Jatrophihabitantaceae bacterium]|nr:TadE/TadG family type IV pilus assembly protein [Jatrophihabitantaceae bacterium]
MRVADDRGSSVVDFVLVSTLLVFLLFAVLQVAVLVYVRNVSAAAAADGARHGAELGSLPGDGAVRAVDLVRKAMPGVAQGIRCAETFGLDDASDLPTVTVRCRGSLRAILLPLHLPLPVDASSTVLRERGL